MKYNIRFYYGYDEPQTEATGELYDDEKWAKFMNDSQKAMKLLEKDFKQILLETADLLSEDDYVEFVDYCSFAVGDEIKSWYVINLFNIMKSIKNGCTINDIYDYVNDMCPTALHKTYLVQPIVDMYPEFSNLEMALSNPELLDEEETPGR